MSETVENRLPVPVSERDHVRGPAAAAVTVVKYGDYECPDCQRLYRDVQKMARRLQDRVRYVFRHFPLVSVHPHALSAAVAAEAAAAQGRFWEMHDLLFLHPDRLKEEDLRRNAHKIGLDLDRFDRDLADPAQAERIMREREQSIIQGISGTPTFYLNERRYERNPARLLEAVEAMADGRPVDLA